MNRKELFAHLKATETQILAERRSNLSVSDSCTFTAKLSPTILAEDNSVVSSDGVLNVKVVASTANTIFFGDMAIAPDAYDKSIFMRGTTIPHIADHEWKAGSNVGDVKKVYTQEIQLSELGLAQEGSTTALIFETSIREDYNSKVFLGYKNKNINQHSIGFTVQQAKLALDSDEPEDVAYKANWDKYYPMLLNASEVDKQGYFIYATEVDVIENSAVLFGANSFTPTLQMASKTFLSSQTSLPTLSALSEQGENTMILEEALKKISDLETEVKQASALATKADRERTIGILEAAKTFGLDHDTAIKAVNKAKWDVEDVVDFFTTIKASQDASQVINTTIVPFGKTSEQATGASEHYVPAFLKQKGAK